MPKLRSIPDIVSVFGSGRDASTRGIRARTRNVPTYRALRIGMLLVRPNRSASVALETLKPYADHLISQMELGMVQVRSGGTIFTTDEVRKALGSSEETEEEQASHVDPDSPPGSYLSEDGETVTPDDPDYDVEGAPAELEEEHTKAELYEEAQELGVEGRSTMDKHGLAEAIVEEALAQQAEPLPEGWEGFYKEDLLDLFETRKIHLPTKTSVPKLKTALKAWQSKHFED